MITAKAMTQVNIQAMLYNPGRKLDTKNNSDASIKAAKKYRVKNKALKNATIAGFQRIAG